MLESGGGGGGGVSVSLFVCLHRDIDSFGSDSGVSSKPIVGKLSTHPT